MNGTPGDYQGEVPLRRLRRAGVRRWLAERDGRMSTFAANAYHLYIGKELQQGSGNLVDNNSEIDFFNGISCDGVGRYTWTLPSGLLHLTLISDPCGRSGLLTLQNWARTP
ncbi:MAG TPA: hypothetical protein VHK65_02650 [Candidatus Dormibacteraeota bacterium]|nr:hypothetical protein [Candidatus Dormibacteraeota bacterium]